MPFFPCLSFIVTLCVSCFLYLCLPPLSLLPSFFSLFPLKLYSPCLSLTPRFYPQLFCHGWFSSLWFVWSALHIPTLFSSRPNMFHTVRRLFMKWITLCYCDHCFNNCTFFFCFKYYEICLCVWIFATHYCVEFCVYKINVCLCKLEHMIVYISGLQTFLIMYPLLVKTFSIQPQYTYTYLFTNYIHVLLKL